jgi:hypothetical protein
LRSTRNLVKFHLMKLQNNATNKKNINWKLRLPAQRAALLRF